MTNHEMDDCLLGIARGEQTALHTLYQALYPSVFLLAASLAGSAQTAEDAAQEVFLVIQACAPRYHEGTSPRAWIYTITRNVTKNLLRKAHYETPSEDIAAGEDAYAETAVHTFEKNCLDGIVVNEALNILGTEEYRITVLHIFGGFKHTEIARYLQIPYGTVLWRYSEAKKKLRRFYTEQSDSIKERDGYER